jgi:hypothetical protein
VIRLWARIAPRDLEELRNANQVIDGRRKHKHSNGSPGMLEIQKLLVPLEGVKILMRESNT